MTRLCWVLVMSVIWGSVACLDEFPYDACVDMKPGYNHIPNADSMPFSITTSKDSYRAEEIINVTISATGRLLLRGFLIQARRADHSLDQSVPIGYFLTLPGTTPTCIGTGQGNGLTHTVAGSEEARSSLTLRWVAPRFTQGHIRFWVTVVVDTSTYWVAEKSRIVRDVTAGPIPTTPPKTGEAAGELFASIDVAECGQRKSCYRNPAGCRGPDCDVIVTWQENGRDLLNFEMSALTQGWVAVGFSDDKKMGEDDVLECVYNDRTGDVEVRMSFNRDSGKANEVHVNEDSGLGEVETYKDDYRVACRFTKDRSATGGVTIWKDLRDAYHVLMAKGDVAEDGVKKRHDLEPGKYPHVSKRKVELSELVDLHGSARYWLVKLHGCLMLIAWMMCCPTAILLAKYYKLMWPNDSLCRTDVWFAVHRGLQCVTLGCTVLGFIFIFIHAGGYSQMPELPDKAHPILGIIVTILCIINPLLALCRCDAKSDKRPIFNWIHWFFGTIAAVLSMPALFIGLNLHKAFVPWWATWVMVAFMLFHLVVELMLEIHGCINSKKQKLRNEEYEMRKKGDHRGDYYSLHPEPVGTAFKKRTLAIYLCVLIICGLIVLLAIAIG